MPTIDENLCNLCGACIPVCVRRILRLGEAALEVTDPALCIECGHCKAVCPANAPQFAEGNEEFEAISHGDELPAPADFLRFLRRRRSVRLYQAKPVAKETLELIIQAGRYAPTGSNRQGCHYTVVSGRQILDRVCTSAIQTLKQKGRGIQEVLDRCRRLKEPLPEEYVTRKHLPPIWTRLAHRWSEGIDQLLYHAPALVLVHTRNGFSTTPEMDAGIASTQMILMAESLGLGTCYIAFVVWALSDSPELRSLLRVPADHRTLAAFTLGYPEVDFLRVVARKPARVTWVQ